MKTDGLKALAVVLVILSPIGFIGPCWAGLLANPSFETPLTAEDWIAFGGSYQAKKVVGLDPQWSYDLSWSLCAPANVQGGGPASGAYQIVSAAPGDRWTVTGFVLNSLHNQLALGCYGLATLEFLGPEGDDTPLQTFSTDRLARTTGDWRPFSIEGIAPEGTARLKVTTMMWRGIFTDTGGALYFDALDAEQLSAVPEPGAVWVACGVVGLAAVVAGRRRRRRAGRGGQQ
jgi:hypothetical protein